MDHLMQRRAIQLYASAVALLLGAALSGCTTTGTAPNPPAVTMRASTIAFSNGVVNTADAEVVTVPATANGATTASTALVGTTTTMSDPIGLAFDSAGNLWVANDTANNVVEFASGATGDVAPITTIAGGSTTLTIPCGLAQASGKVYVADYGADAIDVFSSPSGTVTSAPSERITGLTAPCGVAVDSSGNIWASNLTGTTVVKFAAGASGSATPAVTLSGFSAPAGLAIDRHGNLWVANYSGNDILEFASGATTGASPSNTITGAELTAITGVAVDAKGYLYAVSSSGTVSVFAPDATGAATPVQELSVSTMTSGWGIAVR